jgi:hypothetical protein
MLKLTVSAARYTGYLVARVLTPRSRTGLYAAARYTGLNRSYFCYI